MDSVPIYESINCDLDISATQTIPGVEAILFSEHLSAGESLEEFIWRKKHPQIISWH